MPVSCRNCRNFIQDQIGDGYGIGRCKVVENSKPGELRELLVSLGNQPNCDIFWGGQLLNRECKQYVDNINK